MVDPHHQTQHSGPIPSLWSRLISCFRQSIAQMAALLLAICGSLVTQLSISKNLCICAASIYGLRTSHIDSFYLLVNSINADRREKELLCDQSVFLLHISHNLMKRPAIFDILLLQNFSVRLPDMFISIPDH